MRWNTIWGAPSTPTWFARPNLLKEEEELNKKLFSLCLLCLLLRHRQLVLLFSLLLLYHSLFIIIHSILYRILLLLLLLPLFFHFAKSTKSSFKNLRILSFCTHHAQHIFLFSSSCSPPYIKINTSSTLFVLRVKRHLSEEEEEEDRR